MTSGQKYSYRFTKKTIKYGLLSDSVVRQVTYSAPPKVLSANINKTEKTLDIEIEPSAPFIRMDLYSNGKSIAQTGRTFMTVDLNGLAENISLTLTDRFGNKGQPYSIGLAPDRKQPEIPLVKGLGAVKFDKDLRVFWDSSKAESYVAEICDKGVCETVKTSLPYAVYQKQFDNCLDIAVYATSGEIKSAPANQLSLTGSRANASRLWTIWRVLPVTESSLQLTVKDTDFPLWTLQVSILKKSF